MLNLKNIFYNKKSFYYIILFVCFFVLSYYFVAKFNNQYIIEFEAKVIENKDKWHGELFYNSHHSYSEIQKKDIIYEKTLNEFQKIKIVIANQFNLRYIRLDPLLHNGKVELKNFVVKLNEQSHLIDFHKINDEFYKNNIVINGIEDGILKLDCVGDDPHLDLVKNLHFNLFQVNYLIKALFFVFIFYLIFVSLKYISSKYDFQNILLISMILAYSWYAVLFSSWGFASNLLILFGIASLIIAFYDDIANRLTYIKGIVLFLVIYFLMSYLSIFLSTEHANLNYLNEKLLYIILACLLPLGFYHIKNFNFSYFKIVLTIILLIIGGFIILLNFEYIKIHNVNILGYTMIRTNWTQKNYMFWYVLFMFGVLAFYDIKQKIDLLLVVAIAVFSYFVLFYGHSQSARLAYIVGGIIFIIFSILTVKKKYILVLIWLFTLYVLFTPIFLSLVDLTPYHPRLIERDAIYHTSAAFIKEHWLFGYGYGSTLTIKLKEIVALADLPKHYLNSFPGGHPHNLALLFWLEFGIFGAVFLAYFIHKLLEFVVEKTYMMISQAGLFGMIVAFEILTSFSWSIWYPQVLLTFGFFGAMLMVGINIQIGRKDKI